jgi:hypothetical protein
MLHEKNMRLNVVGTSNERKWLKCFFVFLTSVQTILNKPSIEINNPFESFVVLLKIPNKRWSKFLHNIGAQIQWESQTRHLYNIFQKKEKVLHQSNNSDHMQGEIKTTTEHIMITKKRNYLKKRSLYGFLIGTLSTILW